MVLGTWRRGSKIMSVITNDDWIEIMSKMLHPCPCCGWNGELRGEHFRWGSAQVLFYGYYARCTNPECGVHTAFFQYEFEAAFAWNRRTGLAGKAVFHESVTPDPEETFLLIPHCPCCGGVAHIRTPSFGWIGEIGKFSIVCSNFYECGFGTREHGDLLPAVEEWNRRFVNDA